MNKNLLLFAFLFSIFSYSQTPCVNGFAGNYPCKDYDLQSHVSLAQFGSSSGNDSWGWVDSTTNKEYALMCTNDGVHFIDISNPTNPVILGKLPTATFNSTWRDVKVYKDHAFIVSEASNHGMQVFDLTKLRNVSNPPVTFTADKHYTEFGKAHNIVINEDSGFAYIVGSAKSAAGPYFINIQDPKNPTSPGGFSGDGYTHDAQVVTYNGPDTDYTGKEILIACNEDTITIVDVSNKTNPIQIARLSYPNVKYSHQGWFTEDKKYFILGDELDEQRLGHKTRSIVFDLTNLDVPVVHTEYLGTNNAIDHNGYVKGNTFYLASYTAGVRMIDIADIANKNLSEIGFFDTYPSNDNASFNGVWNVYPYLPSGNIIVSDSNSGLFIIKKSNSLSINSEELRSSFSISPNPTIGNPVINASNKNTIKSIQVFNLLGKEVFSKENINQSQYILEIGDFAKGLYLVKINNAFSKKFIVR
ncbi:choice-of-anchor B domain-containing protein [Lutibacter sp. Hel_I_33_5]|uniref:choice-of-anchor B family protein n=1 Tax=Lutibacter sp. Hel_I_33_5 TaxID=1566289 RepID=UPI0011A0BEC0|nr:choice-of-anchor B family protein [Lutibacter sp. Hel_I_33_5]TVZ56438.1 choice-of-anchor B domain-containing protein [Lutibacter sp. Hel_I_33_5]